MKQLKIAVNFGRCKVKGKINVVNGSLKALYVNGKGRAFGNAFHLPDGGRLEITLGDYTVKSGSFPTILNIMAEKDPFAFFLRDVNSENPIYMPEFQTAVVPGADARSFRQVADAVAGKELLSDFGRFENEPEESYAKACAQNTEQYCPTWLGIGRDMRIFRVGYQPNFKYWGQIQPCYHSTLQSNPAEKGTAYQINFEIGPGAHCRTKSIRRLECGMLPILRAVQDEADIQYHITSFVSLEKNTLSQNAVRGSDWRACYPNTGGNMLPASDREKLAGLLAKEMNQREQETICALRVEAVNVGKTPNYAFFKAPHAQYHDKNGEGLGFAGGMSCFKESARIYAIAMIDGRPMPDEEMSILIQPGRKVLFDILVPHSSLAAHRAKSLFKWDFDKHLEACRDHWLGRLKSAARIAVPETAIDDRIKAGLLHCDLATLGLEPGGPALATIGWYSPIGTESAPIIQFFDSMGWHKLAERSIQFFLERQLESGSIQNFANYQSETGPLLWTAGEHFRYTRDTAWLKRVMPGLRKAADYLLAWRNRNKLPELRHTGCYGLVDGKVADPEDYFHAFFLNAGTYIGLSRMVEMTAALDPAYSATLKKEVKAYRNDIVRSVYRAQARAPLVPVGDGSWAPILPSWPEYTGAHHLYAEGGNCFTHGGFPLRGSIIGANWLIMQEVLEPHAQAADFILKTNQYPVTRENAALSQPYYSRHDFAHLKRGDVKAFLKTYYNQFTALQDRETYTFWEHYFHVSEHKTHEEAWFLMQTRWMLYLEEGDTLSLLKAIPRCWLEDGKQIVLDGVKSYFGPVYFKAESNVRDNAIKAEIRMEHDRRPDKVRIRLAHPEGLRAVSCENGSYDPIKETVTIDAFKGRQTVTLRF